MPDQTQLIILGRDLGTYENWDEVDNLVIQFDEFKPSGNCNLSECKTIQFDFNKGIVECWDDDRELVLRQDLITMISSMPISPDAEQGEQFDGREVSIAQGAAQPQPGEKPHKGVIENWVKFYFNDREDSFYIRGYQATDMPDIGALIETSEVIGFTANGDTCEIETRNSRYTLKSPHKIMEPSTI